MIMKKKLLLGSLLLLALTACGGGKTQETASSGQSRNQVLEGHQVTADLLELDAHFHFSNRWYWDENNPAAKEAEKMTNVRLKNTASTTGTNSTEIFNIMMVSGNMPASISRSMPDAASCSTSMSTTTAPGQRDARGCTSMMSASPHVHQTQPHLRRHPHQPQPQPAHQPQQQRQQHRHQDRSSEWVVVQ